MPSTADYKEIFLNLPIATAVCTPVYEKVTEADKLKDLHIDYVNSSLTVMTNNTIKADILLSEVVETLSPDLDWMEYARKSLVQTVEKSFYSLISKKHLKLTASKTESGQIIACITDISKEKETEQQLRRQNSRLEELTQKLC